MEPQTCINRIEYLFALWTLLVQFETMANRHDRKIFSEAMLIPVLNGVYGWNLENLNEDHQNYPGIDLADEKAKVAVQVTASKTSSKVIKTIRAFIEHNQHNQFRHLFIYILTDRQKTYSGQELQKEIKRLQQKRVTFGPEKNIIDPSSVITMVHQFDAEKCAQLLKILEKHFPEPKSSASKSIFSHSKSAFELLSAYSVLPKADPLFVRDALEIKSDEMSDILTELEANGVEPGALKPRDLKGIPQSLKRATALKLARVMPEDDPTTFHLFKDSRLIWDHKDFKTVIDVYLYEAERLRTLGHHLKAKKLLKDLPFDHPRISLFLATMLKQEGKYLEAIKALPTSLPDEPEALLLKAQLLRHKGDTKEALLLATKLYKTEEGGVIKAEASILLGTVALIGENFAEAERYYLDAIKIMNQIASAQAADIKARASSSLAVAKLKASPDANLTSSFRNVLGLLEDDSGAKAKILNNFGLELEKSGELQAALETLNEALSCAEKASDLATQAEVLNNLGGLYEDGGLNDKDRAIKYFERALKLIQNSGDVRVRVASMENLGMATDDVVLLTQAYDLAKDAGLNQQAKEIRSYLKAGQS